MNSLGGLLRALPSAPRRVAVARRKAFVRQGGQGGCACIVTTKREPPAPQFRRIQICLNDPPATLWQAERTWLRRLLVVTPRQEAPCRYLFSGAANIHGTKADALCACSAPLFGTIAGNIMSLRATASSTCLKTACLLLLAIVMTGGVRAQPANYPDRPVRIISDAAPGGAIDTNLRIIAEGLSQKWARQVVIENRPGAGGAISATAAAEAAPNGYTIYAPASSMFLTIPGKAPNLPLKLPHDFTAIGITVVQPQSIGINPKLGINSLPELIAQAKKKPGSISYAVTGVGRLTHLTGELLQIRANIKLQMVPYTGGPVNSSPA
jgi:hypothetical protein